MSKVSVDRTVFVIGAGVGEAIKIPLGLGLLNSIASKLHFRPHGVFDKFQGDKWILEAIDRRIRETEGKDKTDEYVAACNQIIQGVPFAESIDHLIHLHKRNEKIAYCAKLAIIRCILVAEEGCKLFTRKNDSQPTFASKQLADSWQTRLLQLLCRGVQFDGVAKRLERTKFVIFNYDRCVETYLYEALQIKCGESAEQVAAALNGSTFIHPYGRVGLLP